MSQTLIFLVINQQAKGPKESSSRYMLSLENEKEQEIAWRRQTNWKLNRFCVEYSI